MFAEGCVTKEWYSFQVVLVLVVHQEIYSLILEINLSLCTISVGLLTYFKIVPILKFLPKQLNIQTHSIMTEENETRERKIADKEKFE